MCVNNEIKLFFLIKELAQISREIIFEGGLVAHGKLDSAQVHLRSVFTYSAEEKMLSERSIW